jgi:hypothetical protein
LKIAQLVAGDFKRQHGLSDSSRPSQGDYPVGRENSQQLLLRSGSADQG